MQSFNLGIENSGPALSRGDVDALVESSGVAQKLVDAGVARILFDAGTEGKPEWSVPHIITANGDFLKKYPEVAIRLLEQDIQLASWVDANPEETIQIFVEETGNAEASVRETYRDNVFYQDPEITDAADRGAPGRGGVHGRQRPDQGRGRLRHLDRPQLLPGGGRGARRPEHQLTTTGPAGATAGAAPLAGPAFLEPR